MQDRRSGVDRRATNRFAVNIDVQWEGTIARQSGTLSDISFGGCFVLGTGQVEDGEPVTIFVPLADGMNVEFRGRVANHVFEIGFGVKFDQISPGQRDVINRLISEAGTA
jgi:c-di-GMP-binding flagellar brake protein YcgR